MTPTLLSIAGIRSDAHFQGRDLTESIRGESKSSEPEVTFLRNAGTTAQWIAAVDARYKLVLSVSDRPWLFDIETDPDELLNFFGRPATEEVTQRLAQALKVYADENRIRTRATRKSRNLWPCASDKGKTEEQSWNLLTRQDWQGRGVL